MLEGVNRRRISVRGGGSVLESSDAVCERRRNTSGAREGCGR
jgi:hypothetical protein